MTDLQTVVRAGNSSLLLLSSLLFSFAPLPPLFYFRVGKQNITTLPSWSYDYSSRSRLSTEETRRSFWDYYLTPEYVSSSCLLFSFLSSPSSFIGSLKLSFRRLTYNSRDTVLVNKLVSSAAIQYVNLPIYRLWRSLTLQPVGISVCPLHLFSSSLLFFLSFLIVQYQASTIRCQTTPCFCCGYTWIPDSTPTGIPSPYSSPSLLPYFLFTSLFSSSPSLSLSHPFIQAPKDSTSESLKPIFNGRNQAFSSTGCPSSTLPAALTKSSTQLAKKRYERKRESRWEERRRREETERGWQEKEKR